jgi:hypothetical protein
MQILLSAPRYNGKSGIILAWALLATPALAMAADGSSDQGLFRLGMSPGEPQVRSATPSIPFGVQPATSKEFVLDFHGYLLLPASLGVHERENPLPGQSSTVLHAPPLMAQDLRGFEYTAVVPKPWVQLNFTYGNSSVSATTIMSATTLMDAAGYYNLVEQFGVSDAFITVNLGKYLGVPALTTQVNVGAYTGRYGAMGAYDAGRYATPLIARTNTIGEGITAALKLGDFVLLLEQGLGGQLGRPPVGMSSDGWNDFTNANVGATFVNQVHLGLAYRGFARLGLHYLTAWTQDDQVNSGLIPNGRITVLGADLSLTAARAGHLYIGTAYTKATNAQTVSGAIEILNARGGPELMEQYLGQDSAGNCNGSLTTFGAQYDLSVSRLVFGDLFTGISSDILISLFGVGTKVSSGDSTRDGVFKLKAGGEVTYTLLSWLGVSERLDHVRLDNSDSKKAFTIVSSRLLFHTGWKSRDEFALQYSHFTYGSDVEVKTGYPPTLDPTVNPDRDVFSLTGTFWW